MPFPHRRNNSAVIVDVLVHNAKPSVAGGGHGRAGEEGIAPRARPAFWALLDRCWSAQPSMRPSMGDVVGLLCYLHDTCS